MPLYRYKARDKFGKLISGLMNADSEYLVAAKLTELDYIAISVGEFKEETGLDKFLFRFRRINYSELNNRFTLQLAALQKAGLSILESLNTLKDQNQSGFFKNVISQIIRDIEAGSKLSAALSKYPKLFDVVYVNIIESAETSGLLGDTLDRLAILGERNEAIRMRISMATRYPITVVIAMVLGFLALVKLVLPRFASIYAQYHTTLPLPTQILLWIYFLVTNFWWLLILLAVIFVFNFKKFISTKKGRLWWDSLKLKIPIFGPLLLELNMSRFTRVSGTMMQTGIPILKVLELTSSGTNNVFIARAIDNIKINVSKGMGMLEPMKASGIFPPIVTQMVSVGEKTGKLPELLIHVSDYYDSQINYTVNNLTSLIEPILILVLGCSVLFMALAIFLPVWNLMGTFAK